MPGRPPPSPPASCRFACPNFPTSPAPCSGPDDCPRRPRGLWENRRGPALIPPALAYNRAACPANNRAGLAGYSPLVPQNTWRSDRTGTACRPDETASSRPPPARPRWLGDGDAVDPNCDTELRRSSWQSPCPECRLVRCYGSNRAWHAPTTERSDDAASSLHSAGKHAPTVPRSARSRSTPAVARSDVPHEPPRLRAPPPGSRARSRWPAPFRSRQGPRSAAAFLLAAFANSLLKAKNFSRATPQNRLNTVEVRLVGAEPPVLRSCLVFSR